MKTVTEHIRHSLLKGLGYYGDKVPAFEELVKSEWSDRFATLMLRRLIIGAFRYGQVRDGACNRGTKRTDYMREKLDLYVGDGNAEHLVDIANFCMMEFRERNHPKFHFSALDDQNHMED